MRFILILSFSVHLLSAQQLINRGIFEVCYSEKLQQPLWLEYEVECHTKVYSRKGLNFKEDELFSGVTSDNADYYKNVWDKGHLAPAADFNCNYKSLKATFNYLNCALQHEKLNRGPWKALEAYERELSKEQKVNVRVDLDFDASSLLLETGALVPSYFIKILSYNNIQRVFRFPNDISVYKQPWQDYELKEPFIIIEGCKEDIY
jgi:endonuclease G